MPHLSIDYSPGLGDAADIPALCRALHEALVTCKLFPTAGIRVRAHRADHAVIADDLPGNQYLAMTLSVGAGRDRSQLRGAGEAIFAVARTALAAPLAAGNCALSLEIRVIDPDLSWKENPIHTRLSGKTEGPP